MHNIVGVARFVQRNLVNDIGPAIFPGPCAGVYLEVSRRIAPYAQIQSRSQIGGGAGKDRKGRGLPVPIFAPIFAASDAEHHTGQNSRSRFGHRARQRGKAVQINAAVRRSNRTARRRIIHYENRRLRRRFSGAVGDMFGLA